MRAEEVCEEQVGEVVEVLSQYLGQLRPGALVVELGSRTGHLAAQISGRFPELYVQPSEDPVTSSWSMCLLLQDCVGAVSEGGGGRPAQRRLLAAEFLNPSSLRAFIAKNRQIGCLFAVNVLQYQSAAAVEALLAASLKALQENGFLILSGPFITDDPSDGTLLCHGCLKRFTTGGMRGDGESLDPSWWQPPPASATARQPLAGHEWGLHDVRFVKESAAAAGLAFVAQHSMGEQRQAQNQLAVSWVALVFQPPKSQQVVRRKTCRGNLATMDATARKELLAQLLRPSLDPSALRPRGSGSAPPRPRRC